MAEAGSMIVLLDEGSCVRIKNLERAVDRNTYWRKVQIGASVLVSILLIVSLLVGK